MQSPPRSEKPPSTTASSPKPLQMSPKRPSHEVGLRQRHTPTAAAKNQQLQDSVVAADFRPSSDSYDDSEEVPHRARELCHNLRVEISREIDEQLKQSLDAAVDRIIEQAEAENIMKSSNWLKAK